MKTMKKMTAAALCVGLFASGGAFAEADIKVTLKNGYLPVGDLTTNINNARTVEFTAQANRAGFVKNNFESVLSANVVAGINEDPDNNIIGVVAGSNKGYNVFTGTSAGGSVSQCGAQVAKGTTNLGASLVVTGSLDLEEPNGCGRNTATTP
jgi:hypothetical protein